MRLLFCPPHMLAAEAEQHMQGGVMGEKMKDYYTVGEISRLYGIGTDSLRYYEEIGALSPKRGKNNYRLYSLKDIYRLNIIRDLLTLGVSMKQIREYLDCQNMESTFRLLSMGNGEGAGAAEAASANRAFNTGT